MKIIEHKSLNFIIGYALGKIQQFWLGMQSNNYVHDGSVIVIPKEWLGLPADLPETQSSIITQMNRLFNELVPNYCMTCQIKNTDYYLELHYVITKLPDVKKMTVADIEKELGYKIEIISE